MTREELKKHCEKQMEMCEMWAISKGEKPSGKIYEEHNLILELLEKETILDKIRAEIEQFAKNPNFGCLSTGASCGALKAIEIIDKYKGSEE